MSGIQIHFKQSLTEKQYFCLIVFDKSYSFNNIALECEECEIQNSIIDIRNKLGQNSHAVDKFKTDNDMKFPAALRNAIEHLHTAAHINKIDDCFLDIYLIFKDTSNKNNGILTQFVSKKIANCFCVLDNINQSHNILACISRYITTVTKFNTCVNILYKRDQITKEYSTELHDFVDSII